MSVKNIPYHTIPLCYLLPSLLIRGEHTGNMCIPGWLIGFFRHACYLVPCFFYIGFCFTSQVSSLIPTSLMTHKSEFTFFYKTYVRLQICFWSHFARCLPVSRLKNVRFSPYFVIFACLAALCIMGKLHFLF